MYISLVYSVILASVVDYRDRSFVYVLKGDMRDLFEAEVKSAVLSVPRELPPCTKRDWHNYKRYSNKLSMVLTDFVFNQLNDYILELVVDNNARSFFNILPDSAVCCVKNN